MAGENFIIENGCLMKYNGNASKVMIPEGVTTIKTFAFRQDVRCPSKTKVIIFPDSLESIEKCAVSRYWNLESVNIPKSVRMIAEGAFTECSTIKEISVDPGNAFYHSKNNCLIDNESNTIILGCSKSIIPQSEEVTSIGAFAFLSCKYLFKIEIPSNIISINKKAFACSDLREIVIREGCCDIGESAFWNCQKLKRVSLPNSVNNIGEDAFAACENMTISAPSGSYAEKYAVENAIPFVSQETIENDRLALQNNAAFPLPIESLNLSAKTTNNLIRYGIRTVANLVDLKELEIREVRGIGNASFEEIKNKFNELNLFFSKW